MNFIRNQRSSEGYDPYQSHWIFGSDADLIMLWLTLHEPRISIIREEFLIPYKRKWSNCSSFGHDFDIWKEPKLIDKSKKFSIINHTTFQYVKINLLREYLELELEVNDGVHTNIENKIDDFIFLWFIVGNDFLPHLPSFRIRNGAIDLIVSIYKSVLPQMQGYLIQKWKEDSGDVNEDEFYINLNIGILLSKLASVEEELDLWENTNNEHNIYSRKARKRQREQQIDLNIWANRNLVDFTHGDWRLSYYQSKFHIQEDDLSDFLK